MNLLEKYLDKIMMWLEAGAEVVTEKAPGFIQEVLSYYTIINMIWGGVFLTLILGLIILLIISIKEYKMDDEWAVGIGLSCFGLAGFLIGACYCIGEAIKISVAPTLYIIQKVSELL